MSLERDARSYVVWRQCCLNVQWYLNFLDTSSYFWYCSATWGTFLCSPFGFIDVLVIRLLASPVISMANIIMSHVTTSTKRACSERSWSRFVERLPQSSCAFTTMAYVIGVFVVIPQSKVILNLSKGICVLWVRDYTVKNTFTTGGPAKGFC